MDYAQIFRAYIAYSLKHPEQRQGQALFNYLYSNEQTRDFAKEIRATGLDPFYNDKLIGEVLAKLAIKMVEEEDGT